MYIKHIFPKNLVTANTHNLKHSLGASLSLESLTKQQRKRKYEVVSIQAGGESEIVAGKARGLRIYAEGGRPVTWPYTPMQLALSRL